MDRPLRDLRRRAPIGHRTPGLEVASRTGAGRRDTVRLRPDLVGFRHRFVWQFLQLQPQRATLIDTGMEWAARRIRRWFADHGRPPDDLKDILLTHGHLDHVGFAESLRRWSGATVHLHPLDEPITRGRFAYRGAARMCGVLERFGRAATRYRPPRIDAELQDGQRLDLWGGLEVVHLPGHTLGHVGFHCPAKQTLFIGDVVLVPRGRTSFPLRIFTVDDALNRRSAVRAAELDVDVVYPNHGLGGKYLVGELKRYARWHRRTVA